MTLNKQKLRNWDASAMLRLSDEQERIILERFGEEPWPYVWGEQDISEQISQILHDHPVLSKSLSLPNCFQLTHT